ncbi:MAG: alpha/beta hydrolase, partial [Leptolyngbya sp. SIO3F4]|nr:alpha/beta hydrolase [Leptolyngbya sp. SIO3F4]
MMKVTRWFRNLALYLGSTVPLMVGTSALAADSVTVSYGLLELSVPVPSLESYAYENQIDAELEFYLNFLSEKERTEFRGILTEPLDVT